MKYLDSYRDPRVARELLDQIGRTTTRPWTLLDLCGGQAQNLARFRREHTLPASLQVVHGPACPICALPEATLRWAISIAAEPGVILCAPGDLLRVPAGRDTLNTARSRGLDIRVVYSPLDALGLARKHPDREVVMLAVGFETTAPPAAAAVIEADRLGLPNLWLITGFFRMEAAVERLLADPPRAIDAVLVPGLVCAVTGFRIHETLAATWNVPIVVAGPEPVDLLESLLRAIRRLETGAPGVENQYARAVRPDGNPQARASIATVFEPSDAEWRGMGRLANSGLVLREPFRRFDASSRFRARPEPLTSTGECQELQVITGRIRPVDCPSFGTRCSPDRPLGVAMASAEGTCAAYYRYRGTGNNPPAPSTLPVIAAHAVPGASP